MANEKGSGSTTKPPETTPRPPSRKFPYISALHTDVFHLLVSRLFSYEAEINLNKSRPIFAVSHELQD